MTVVVSFFTPKGIGHSAAPGIGACRIKEVITVPGTTTNALAAGEMAIIVNGETVDVLAANGTTPDAQAAASTAASSAGYPCPIGVPMVVVGSVGDKINIKVVA